MRAQLKNAWAPGHDGRTDHTPRAILANNKTADYLNYCLFVYVQAHEIQQYVRFIIGIIVIIEI